MALSFKKIKAAGIPGMSAKSISSPALPKLPEITWHEPKVGAAMKYKTPNLGKYTKLSKIPKSPKMAVIKKALKKIK